MRYRLSEIEARRPPATLGFATGRTAGPAAACCVPSFRWSFIGRLFNDLYE
jgi:hypothetical protein